jgi:4-alpha-glucanotransferase
MDDGLRRLADAAGIEPSYWDINGQLHECSAETARALLQAMGIAAGSEEDVEASLRALNDEEWREILPPVIVAREGEEFEIPVRLPADDARRHLRWSILCEGGQDVRGEWRPEDTGATAAGEVDGRRMELRRLRLPPQPAGYHRMRLVDVGETSLIVSPPRCYLPPDWELRKYWGIAVQLYSLRSARNWGMGDFGDLAQLTTWPADAIGINPLHALFLDAPDGASPYAPCSRLFVNPLYLDVDAVAAFLGLGMEQGTVPVELDHQIERARASDVVAYSAIAAAKLAVLERLFQNFRSGTDLARNDDFRAFMASGGVDLGRFTAFQSLSEHFATHDWARWPQEFRDPNFQSVRALSGELEARSAFFAFLQWQCDLQLGAAAQRSRECGMRFNEKGQEWGIVPLDPRLLRSDGYAYFKTLLRANMRHAGAVRVDHVMGLMRQFVIPAGASPSQGAYIRFPFEDLLGIVALESARHQCVVIGEDLGTVPAGFRERMADADVLSSRVLYFEREHGRFRSPGEFPSLAAVSVSTHDLATLRGYWTEEDIRAKDALGIFASPNEKRRALEERASDKSLLLQALAHEALLPPGIPPDAASVSWSPELATAVHAYLARCQSKLLLVQLDDLAGEELQANLPGSTSEYPSWRRRVHRSIEDLSADPQIRQAIAVVAAERAGNAKSVGF